ncbi:MAG: DUF5985 family protein [Kofleriaceae bacterium]
MPELVYGLCALTSLFCAGLLVRAYFARRTKLLLWSSLCFVGLAVNNIVLVVDFLIGTTADLSLVRTSIALVAMLLLMVGLAWETR